MRPKGIMNVTISPTILKAMREHKHIPEEVAATRLKISLDDYRAFESSEHEVSIAEANKIAGIYKRNWTLFLLKKAPGIPNFGQDNRTANNKKTALGYLTFEAVEEAKYTLDFIVSSAEDTTNNIPQFDRASDPEVMAEKFREAIGVPADTNEKMPDAATTLNFWIERLGQIGINVSNYKLGEDDKVRAFSLFNQFKATIVLNSEETDKGKLFSLMHELGHILIRNTGVCDLSRDSIESFCNKFASHLLIPTARFIELVQKYKVEDANADATSTSIARSLKVSKLAVLTRMLENDFIGSKCYDTLATEEYRIFNIRKQMLKKGREAKKTKPVINPYVVRKARIGSLFLNEIFDAYHQTRITPYEATRYLGFKNAGIVGKFDQWVGSQKDKNGPATRPSPRS